MAISIALKDFQSFDETGCGLRDVARINVLIGPNNSGKSKILKAVDRTIRPHGESLMAATGSSYSVDVSRDFDESELKSVFRPGYSGGNYPGDHWNSFGIHTVGSRATIRYSTSQEPQLVSVEARYGDDHKRPQYLNLTEAGLKSIRPSTSPLFSRPVFYIAAERDIVPEARSDADAIQPSGRGVTNLIRRILRSVGRDKEPVEKWLLSDLNAILAPDHQFSRIEAQEHSNELWEIFLEEQGKGWVPLSQCGSGLKTVVHLLALTNLVADREGGKISSGTFLLEELENCLHPHVQRNVFRYLDEIITEPARVFLTTHSSVCLDYFQGHSDAILTQVYQVQARTKTRCIEAFQDRCGTLDRMGSRASDALQSNAVIWVEGPSDRILLKCWLTLRNAKITEGSDYSIMFYGGDLLAHLTMDDSAEVQEYVRLLRINRNSAIIIDSDKKYQAETMRETKRRVKEGAEKEGRFVWITRGKEIENYIAPAFFKREFSENAPSVAQYEPPWPKLHGLVGRHGKTLNTKVQFAEYVAANSSLGDFQFDWDERVDALISYILKANGRS